MGRKLKVLTFCRFSGGGSFLLTQYELSGSCDPVLMVEATGPLGHNVDPNLVCFILFGPALKFFIFIFTLFNLSSFLFRSIYLWFINVFCLWN